MATNTKNPLPTNGVITAPVGNRKKQKRRQKQALKAAAQSSAPQSLEEDQDQQPDVGYEDTLGFDDEDEDDYSDPEPEHYHHGHMHSHAPAVNGMHSPPLSKSKKKNKKKKASVEPHGHYDPGMLPPLPPTAALSPGGMRPSMRGGPSHENIWNVSTAQERQNIKEFWLSLSEEDRKSLLKIEKEAVLKKMKQQQKHSCSCTVCGRKRTAIEEELEVLYEGYYEELEQYAHHDHPPLPNANGMMPDPLQHRRQHPLAFHPPSPPPMPHHKISHLHEHLDEEEYSDEDEEEYSDEDEEDEEDYSDEDPEPEPMPHGRPPVQDFFSFGSQLTVKGILTPWVEKLKEGLKGNADNLLTVADDLLKNDGRKFIEMMEQLAERRMQRENRSHYESEHHAGYPPDDAQYSQEDPLAAGDEYDDEEASYDSQDEYDDDMDEEDEMGGLTEEQRMQEGRRMFQIFAARMFEQRVLQAYREKVAEERQAKLLAELDDEKSLQAQREAKKQRDAQKKKEKKKQQQQVKAEEKAKRDAEKAAEEAKVKAAEEKKLEEQRRKKEEQKRKREEEKRKQDEEKARKESEKQRRLLEEQQRREEAERKAREAKAAEKARKDEARKREREEREAREKEARDRKTQEEKEKKDREAKSRAEKECKEKTAHPAQHQPQITKRPSQPGMVAVPGVYPKQTPSGISSPHPQIATPAIPKAPTPAKQRQASHQASQASSPKQAQSQLSSAPSKSSSPGSSSQQQGSSQPKTILQKAGNQQPVGQQSQNPLPTPSPLHQHPMQPPPGMPHPHQQRPTPFGGIPHMGFPAFPGGPGSFAPGNMSQHGPMPGMFPPQGPPPIGMQSRMSFPGMNGGMPPPPGMMAPQGRNFSSFDAGAQPPPGFGQPLPPQNNHVSPIGQSPSSGLPGHSRQQSSEKERFESAANQPIGRPVAPIQRPNSVKPGGPERNGSNSDVDDLSKHLGSSALLADDDEPLPSNPADNRRHSNLAPGSRNISIPSSGLGQLGGFGPPGGGFGTPSNNWGTPSMPFGQSPSLGQPGWGSLPNSGLNSWGHNSGPFGVNGFGPMGPGAMQRGSAPVSRPLTIRQNVCNACKQLTIANRDQGDGFHDVQILLRQIEANRPMLDSPPSLREIEEICETEGDAQNGGGLLHVRQNEGGEGFSVKWELDAGTPDQGRGHGGLGEIGSPLPGKILPVSGSSHFGFGAPGMGRGLGNLQPLGPRAD